MQSHGIATPEVGPVKPLASASVGGAPAVLIPIVGGSVAVSVQEAGDFLSYLSVPSRIGYPASGAATAAELRMELGHLLVQHGMAGLREATADCAWEVEHGHPEDAAHVFMCRELVRRLASTTVLAGAPDVLAVAK